MVCSIRLLGLVEELDGLLLQQTIMIIIVFVALIKAPKDSNSISYSYTIPIVPIFSVTRRFRSDVSQSVSESVSESL